MKEPYEKPDVVSEEIFERTALSCGGISTSTLPSGSSKTYILTPKAGCESCMAVKS